LKKLKKLKNQGVTDLTDVFHAAAEKVISDDIHITRPSVPALEDFVSRLPEIWRSRQLANRGPALRELESELARYLDVPYVTVVANATVGLMLALRHLKAHHEVVTTPYSYHATAHAARWNGAELVFADVDPKTLNIDPECVERSITERTQAILAVHCYGTPCDTEALQDIARRHDIPLVYDAAHAFGVIHRERSLTAYGDLAVISMHATKVFNTLEGGAIISHDAETKAAIDSLANYGLSEDESQINLGFNAKMSELNAAFGLALLPEVDDHIAARRRVADRYRDELQEVAGLRIVCDVPSRDHNYYAFPLIIQPEYPLKRDELHTRMLQAGIHTRRYFHRLISEMPLFCDMAGAHPDNLPNAHAAASHVLCLPIYPDLASTDQSRVINILRHG
jgi:dTDP-4-amino-4,6-dideoxygalactose transaminase